MINILFEDKSIVVCEKPVGVSSQGEDPNSMITLLKSQLNSDIFPIHRLDQTVGGLMVYAKNSQAAGKLSGQMAQDQFTKEYLAIVQGTLEKDEDTLEDLLFHDKRKNKSYVVDRQRNGVKSAKLSYKVLDSRNESSLIRVHLYTGRTHQIRVQFASRKHPLIGDGKYGDKSNKNNISLYSAYLKFSHPFKKEVLEFSSKPDLNSSWDLYKEYTKEGKLDF